MRLLLIRHGQTPANVLGELDTAVPGPGLTALGQQQADALPQALREESVTAIYASTLTRTQLTAAPLAAALGIAVQVLPGLQEIEAGELESRSDEASVRAYMATVIAWVAGEPSQRMPGAGDGDDFFGRFDAAIARIAGANDDTVAVFSHGAAIRVWVAERALNISGDFTLRSTLDNTGVAVLDGSPRHGWNLVSWQGDPVGGEQLADAGADDPTGEATGRPFGIAYGDALDV